MLGSTCHCIHDAGKASLHIGSPPAEDLAVMDSPAERIKSPLAAIPGRDYVHMAV